MSRTITVIIYLFEIYRYAGAVEEISKSLLSGLFMRNRSRFNKQS